MIEGILAGCCIGYILFVLSVELELQVCRVCTIWWLSVVCCVILWNAWLIGLINLVAHASYIAFKEIKEKLS